ncbi:methyltransferase domain-containing protein [Thermaurantiacus sp.]
MFVWRDLARRADEAEWMDTEVVSEAEFACCLADLETVNWLTLAARPTLRFLARLTANWPEGSELRLVDAGSGQGGMLRHIHAWATRRGLVPRLTGVDLNPHAAEAAKAATPSDMAIDWVTADIFDIGSAFAPHVITSALFAHHLDDEAVVRFLVWMEATASHGWFVNDLHRHGFAYYGFAALAGVMRWHPLVRHDGPLSIARAFTRADWVRLLAAAGISDAKVSWHLPFRLCVERVRP